MKANDPSHDWFHVERVYKTAVYLTRQEQLLHPDRHYDQEIIELAALFHDAVDFKYDHDKGKSLNVIAEERLRPFFGSFAYPADRVDKIIFIILNISWRKELENSDKQVDASLNCELELNIVRDADRLDAIGAVGIARCMAFSGAKMRPLYVEGVRPIENMTAAQYNEQAVKNESTAINHFHEKLLLIKDKMKTETGKRLASQRNDFMVEYLRHFDLEVSLDGGAKLN
jgi:uncharacterized protein